MKATGFFLWLPFLLAGSVQAATVIAGTTSITFTGTATEFFTNESTLIDGSGLSAAPSITNTTVQAVAATNFSTISHANAGGGNAWTTNDPGGFPSDYFASTADTVSFEVLFDDTYTLREFHNWSYDFGAFQPNNVSAATLEYGVGNFTDGSTGITIPVPPTGAGSALVTLPDIVADRVRLTFTDNYFGTGTGGDRVGLAEFRFIAVPEPSRALLLGLGASVLILRRRRS